MKSSSDCKGAMVALSALLGVQAGWAADASARWLAHVEPSIKAICETGEYALGSFDATWLPDGSGYLRLETPAAA